MKRLIALLLVCMMMTASVLAEDYTVAEKLYKQLWAGSGFSGTLNVEIQSESFSTAKPLTAAMDYIYVRETDQNAAEHRLDLTLMDGENAISAAYAQLQEGALSFQADVLSPDWFTLPLDVQASQAEQAVQQAAAGTGAPALAGLLASGAMALRENEELAAVLESYLTRMDLWIEGYRQDAVLSKLDDETVMQVHYVLTPAAIKAQVKQLVVDLLNDEKALPLLAEALGEEQAALYLNPALQKWYFEAVDSLPFPGDLTLSRTLTLAGETVELHLSLPMYDAQTGVVTLNYDRTRGTGDLPDENVLRLESAEKVVVLTYQEYSSMTGVQVVQGTLVSEPAQDFAVEEEAQAFGVSFTLRYGANETVDDEGRDVYACEYALTLAPLPEGGLDFEEVDMALNARFVSKPLKSAATEAFVQAELTSADKKISLQFEGASRKKWTPEMIPAGEKIASLADEAIASLLPGAALRGMAVLSAFVETTAGAE